MWQLAMIFLLKTVLSSSLFLSDQCVNVCKDADLPSLELENYEQIVCQRGCRFFNLIKFKDEVKVNTTRKECHISCDDSYINKEENKICQTGCNLMAKEQEILVSGFLIEAESSIVLASPDREIEFDLLSDPSIKSQLEVGFNVDYKIPETHIRTMPIEITEEEITIKESGDWLDCASRNSGIPRWILLSAILFAVLIALWLSFSTEKRSSQEENVDVDIPDDKLILENEYIAEKDPSILENDPNAVINEEVKFIAPPKYSVESEKV
ncbi:hypothetical protein NQ318_009449 [Aromia moschata]|uniref:Transmembrane protein 59 n=1 Tax=Aromia moschata TaxID=1265417 RepID=A0AAV8ZA57_9CUCU|nr:hypothetical protein NQ318_009449 [Aromia moschata]